MQYVLILNLITSAKALILNTATFTYTGDQNTDISFQGDTIQSMTDGVCLEDKQERFSTWLHGENVFLGIHE